MQLFAAKLLAEHNTSVRRNTLNPYDVRITASKWYKGRALLFYSIPQLESYYVIILGMLQTHTSGLAMKSDLVCWPV